MPATRIESRHPIISCNGLLWATLWWDGEGTSVSLDGEDLGSWPTPMEAIEFARMAAAERSGGAGHEKDPLAEHRERGATLVVTFDHMKKKFAIVAGYKPWRFEDTGLRFDTEGEARRRRDAAQGD